ncbi:MAG: HAD family hydrolase [Faecousia sp.]
MTGILFDLDGTLLDTLDDLMDGVNHALAQFGYPQRTRQEVRRFVGNGAARLMQLSVPRGEDWQKPLEVFQSYYREHCQIKTAPYPGIPEALEILSKHYPIAIISNKPDRATKKLCARYFPGIYAQGEIPGCPRKPAPDMVFHGMEQIGADRCIYVGDSEVDVLTAQNAGVRCLSVLWGFRDEGEIRAAGGSRFCDHPRALVDTLENMMKETE